jgi:hypothetical protein
VPIAAVHESEFGPSRHVAPPHDIGRNREEAEIDEPKTIAERDVSDRSRQNKFATDFSPGHEAIG